MPSLWDMDEEREARMKEALETTPFVFVYGTLKRGFGNNRILSDSEFKGKATTVWNYAMFDAGVPFLMDIHDFGEDRYHSLSKPCRGEVFEVEDTSVMSRLDYLESEGTLYKRFLAEIKLDDGSDCVCWAYKTADDWPLSGAAIANVDPLGRYSWRD